jgi:hypothetical protein
MSSSELKGEINKLLEHPNKYLLLSYNRDIMMADEKSYWYS